MTELDQQNAIEAWLAAKAASKQAFADYNAKQTAAAAAQQNFVSVKISADGMVATAQRSLDKANTDLAAAKLAANNSGIAVNQAYTYMQQALAAPLSTDLTPGGVEILNAA